MVETSLYLKLLWIHSQILKMSFNPFQLSKGSTFYCVNVIITIPLA